MSDTIPGNTSSTAVLPVGSSVRSAIDHNGDRDWFRVDLIAGVGYWIEVVGSGDNPALNVPFYIYDEQGNFIWSATFDPGGDGALVDGFTPEYGGVYFIAVGAPNTSPGQYTVTATPMVDDEPSGPGNAQPLPQGVASNQVDNGTTATIDSIWDEDWYAIDLVAGQIYRFNYMDGRDYGGQLEGAEFVLYDPNGYAYTTGGFEDYVEVDITGTWYVALTVNGATASAGTYWFNYENEASGNIQTLQTMTLGVEQTGSILWEGDSDWYRVNLEAGVSYEFHLVGQLYPDFYVRFGMRDAAGTLLATGDGSGVPTLVFTASAAGEYYFEVISWDSRTVEDPILDYAFGYYAVTYDTVDLAADNFVASAATTGQIAVGDTLVSTLEARADRDWFAVQLVAGHAYTFRAASLENGFDVAPQFILRNADGSAVNLNAIDQFSYVATATGTYYIDVGVRPEGSSPFFILPGGSPGAYALTVEEDIRADINTTAVLAESTTFTSTMRALGERDWFRVNLVAGETYYFSIDTLGETSHLQGMELLLRDATGTVIFSPILNQNYLSFTATTSGVYYLDVGARWSPPQWDINYTIGLQHLNVGVDLYAFGTSSTGVITTASPVSSAIDFESDVDWLSFSVVAGQYYTLTLSGTGPTPLEALYLAVLTSGVPSYVTLDLGRADDPASVTFQAQSTGSMWAMVAPQYGFHTATTLLQVTPETGGYTLVLSETTNIDALANNASTTGVATLGAPFQSSIDHAGDVDWVRVSVVEGEYYTFAVTGDEAFEREGFFVRVGSEIGHTLQYQANVTGDIYVQVSSTWSGAYTLNVSAGTPVDPLRGLAVTPNADGVFRLYFVEGGETVTGASGTNESVGWTAQQMQSMLDAWGTIAEYANISFEVTTDQSEADFVYVMIASHPLASQNDGQRSGPIGADQSLYMFHTSGDSFGAAFGSAAPGELGWAHLLTIISGGLGLGNRTEDGESERLAGVGDTYQWGDFWLNQGIYTLTGYHVGWRAGEILYDDVPNPIVTTPLNSTIIDYAGVQATPMALDIAALQALYGVNANANAGDTVHSFANLTNGQWRAIWDTGGADTITVDPLNTSGAVIDLRAATLQYEWGGGGFASYVRGVGGGFTIAGGVVIENAIGGAGADWITGNAADNVLTGNDGDDILDGGTGGADTFNGGAGLDVAGWSLAGAGVSVDLQSGILGGAAEGDVLSSIEGAIGSAFDDELSGDDQRNVLIGGAGDDSLAGRGGDDTLEGDLGADVLDGGLGFDTASYQGSNQAVSVQLNGAGAGGDAAGDTLIGFEALIGSDFDDALYGDGDSNRLDGGMGRDTLVGGAGDDTYVVDRYDDVVVEAANEGVDRVMSLALTYTLAANVEILELVRLGASSGVGNALDNTILGNDGDNDLTGAGGADQLVGGGGYDLARYDGSDSAVTVNLLTNIHSGGHAQGDILLSIEGVVGSGFNDTLTGDGADNLLDGAAGADTIYGGGGADLIYGADGNDVLLGGAGADVLLGESGGDSLDGGHGADFLDGGAGVDTAFFNSSSTAASWWRNPDGSWTVLSADGPDTTLDVEYLAFTDRDVFLDRATNSFFGDGTSDILLRRFDGVTAIWNMAADGLVYYSAPTQWQAGLNWSLEAFGDFNSDGRDDFLLRRNDGVTSIWSMNGVSVIGAGVTQWQAGLEWSIQAAGDFNGDGSDDILWRRASDGVTSIWQMSGTSVVAADVTHWQAGLEWTIQGVGDFNGDGRHDFLWRRESDGVTSIWQMDGTNVAAADVTTQQAGTEWSFVGIGDFDGDGRDDMLLRRDDGATAIWLMDGTTTLSSGTTTQQAGTDWSIAAVGDYNGDGRDDILLVHDSGVMAVWTMNGFTVVSADLTSQTAGPGWTII